MLTIDKKRHNSFSYYYMKKLGYKNIDFLILDIFMSNLKSVEIPLIGSEVSTTCNNIFRKESNEEQVEINCINCNLFLRPIIHCATFFRFLHFCIIFVRQKLGFRVFVFFLQPRQAMKNDEKTRKPEKRFVVCNRPF